MSLITLTRAKKYTDATIAGGDGTIPSRVTTLENNMSLQDQQEQTLVHGLQVINSDTASNLKVEFYGQTRVNHIPNFNSGLWNLASGTTVNSSKKITTTGDGTRDDSIILFNAKANQEYLIKIKHNAKITINLTDNTGTTISTPFSYVTDQYVKFITTSDTERIRLTLSNYSMDYNVQYTFEDVRCYIVSSEIYNEIGVSLLDEDVERSFPYVDSIKGISNPIITVSGQNLLPPFTEWTLHANAKVISPYELELNATGSYQGSSYTLDVVKNQDYKLSKDTVDGKYIGNWVYDDGTTGSAFAILSHGSIGSQTITSPSNAKQLKITVDNHTSTGTFTFKNPMLNLGSTAKPFVEKNDSYLYAETSLYGNDNKKDILYRNFDLNRWEKIKWWEQVTLDGSLGWGFVTDKDGFKEVSIQTSELPSLDKSGSSVLKKFNDSIVTYSTSYAGDTFHHDPSTTSLYMRIKDSDTGWTETMLADSALTNAEKQNMIKAYFNGWQYTGDGTTHSWISLVDGTTPSTNTLAYVSINQAPSYKNYFLLYQLAESVVVPLDNGEIEGDLSIQGDAQVSVDTGILYEEVTPYLYTTPEPDRYYINHSGVSTSSMLKHNPKKYIGIYKDGKLDDMSKWVFGIDSDTGDHWAYVLINDFDTSANYTVRYEPKNKYSITTNLNNVVAHYNNSMKSSFNDVVATQSDHGAKLSVLERQVVLMDARLDAGGL